MMMTMAIMWVISSHLHVFAGAAARAWRNQRGTRLSFHGCLPKHLMQPTSQS
jgi:hypothetical protein